MLVFEHSTNILLSKLYIIWIRIVITYTDNFLKCNSRNRNIKLMLNVLINYIYNTSKYKYVFNVNYWNEIWNI